MIRSIMILLILLSSCNDYNEPVVKTDCSIDRNFVGKFLADIGNVLSYNEENGDDQGVYKAFINLEVVTGSRDLDSLAHAIYKEDALTENVEEYYDKWMGWLSLHQCATYSYADSLFNDMKYYYPPKNYKDFEVLRKLRLKNGTIVNRSNLSQEESDLIIIERDSLRYLNRLPGWSY